MCIHRYKKERLWLWRDKPAQAVKKRQTASYIGFNERGKLHVWMFAHVKTRGCWIHSLPNIAHICHLMPDI